MKTDWSVEFYRNAAGRESVAEFLDSLPERACVSREQPKAELLGAFSLERAKK